MANVKIMALGGLGENGKNMYLVEASDMIFILDAGLKYPDIDMFGVDAVVPNINYLIENKNRIAGIFLSHGHEDNIGAIPYLLRNVQASVYATHFTISLIENLLVSNNMDFTEYRLYRINENKSLKFKDIQVSFFNTSHSIPESVGIVINTLDGAVVYATDFNFMPTNENKYETNFSKLTTLGKENVLALMTESVGTSTIGRINNDMLLEHNFNNVLTYAKKRIIVGAYSSDLSRIQKIIDLSILKGRKICLIGYRGEKLVETAILNNYLRIPQKSRIAVDKINEYDPSEEVIIVHGQREEVYTMLVKMSFKEDENLALDATDEVILMCPPVSGTEKLTTDAINTMYRNGLELIIFDKDVLRSSHASRDDLKLIYNLVKPKYIIPIKGEYRHMYEQMLVAKESGFNRNRVLLLDNGEVANFVDGVVKEYTNIPVGDIFVDGSLIGDVNEEVIKERETLSTEGIVIINIYYDIRKRTVEDIPSIKSRGVVGKMEDKELVEKIKTLSKSIFENSLWKKNYSIDTTTKKISDEITRLIFRITKHKPLVIISSVDVTHLVSQNKEQHPEEVAPSTNTKETIKKVNYKKNYYQNKAPYKKVKKVVTNK